MFWIYVIVNEDKKIYIGQTDNLEKRLQRHNKELPFKKKSYTYKQRGSWKFIYTEKALSRKEALKREKELKSCQGRLFIRGIINNTGR